MVFLFSLTGNCLETLKKGELLKCEYLYFLKQLVLVFFLGFLSNKVDGEKKNILCFICSDFCCKINVYLYVLCLQEYVVWSIAQTPEHVSCLRSSKAASARLDFILTSVTKVGSSSLALILFLTLSFVLIYQSVSF